MPIYTHGPGRYFDSHRPLHSSIGRGERGEKGSGLTVRVAEGDPYGFYRLQFVDTDTNEVVLTTPNLDPGSRIYVCDKLFESREETDKTYSAVISDFTTEQLGQIRNARVGDVVMFEAYTESADKPNAIGVGVITSISGNAVTFKSHEFLSVATLSGDIQDLIDAIAGLDGRLDDLEEWKTGAQDDIDDAFKYATNYIMDDTDGAMWIHGEGMGPNEDGTPKVTTRGWSIGDALQLWRGTKSLIKAWVDSGKSKVRIGASDEGHTVVDNDGLEIYSVVNNVLKKVAEIGEEIVLGALDTANLTLNKLGIDLKDEGQTSRFKLGLPGDDAEALDPNDVVIVLRPDGTGKIVDADYQYEPVKIRAIVESDMNYLMLGNPGVGVDFSTAERVVGIPLSVNNVYGSATYSCQVGEICSATVDFTIPDGYTMVSVCVTVLNSAYPNSKMLIVGQHYSAGGSQAVFYMYNAGSADVVDHEVTLRANCIKVGN